MSAELEPKIERANTFHLYADISWMAFTLAVEWYYLQVYAIRMGATPLHLAVLTSGRALLLAIGSGLTGMWCRRYVNLVKAVSFPLLISRVLIYLGLALVPFAPSHQVDLLVGLVCLSAIPMGVSQGVFLSMLPTAVSRNRLARVVANRSILMNGLVLLCMVFLGQMLEWFPKPENYQIAFGIGFLASLMSWWHVERIQVPNIVKVDRGTRRANVWANRPFRRFMIVVIAINTSVFMAGSIGSLQLVRNLNASDTWVSVFGICEVAGAVVGTMRMDWLIRKFGPRWLIIATTMATLFQPLVLGITPILPPFIFPELLFGAGWGIVNVLLYNQLVELVPPDDMADYAAMYQLIINMSLFVGPLIGTFLIENVMSISAALVLIGGLRFLAAVLAWGIRIGPVSTAGSSRVEAVTAAK
ncbi:MAG TPA: MFS transporter [Aggregatilineales bacterium]|nr:MFS transporter [Aggregatilineales bacterium]